MQWMPINKSQLLKGFEAQESAELSHHIQRGARLTTWSSTPALLLLLGIQLSLGDLHVELALRHMAILTATWLLVVLALHKGWFKKLTTLYLAYGSFTQLTLTSMPWLRLDGTNPTVHTAYTALMIVALFCPMRPAQLMLLGLITALGECLTLALTQATLPEILLESVLGLMAAAHAAGAAALVRSLWMVREDAQQQLIAADRLSTLGRHTAGVAHELKTPLASAHMNAYALKELGEEMLASIGHPTVQEQDLREIAQEWMNNVQGVRDGLERSMRFVNTLREHTQQMHQEEQQWFPPGERLEAVSHLLRNLFNEQRVSLHFMPASQDTCIHGDPHKFDQLIINLVNNAVEACTQASQEHCEVAILSRVKGKTLFVVVQDNGPGVPERLREKIFEPLFTTKGKEGGTGLGLAMCRDITQGLFGGTLALVESQEGARFEICIPLDGKRARTPQAHAQRAFTPFPDLEAGQPGPHSSGL